MQWRREQAHTCGSFITEGIGLHGVSIASTEAFKGFSVSLLLHLVMLHHSAVRGWV